MLRGASSLCTRAETTRFAQVAIESYLDEAERALRYIQETDKVRVFASRFLRSVLMHCARQIPLERKRHFWRTLSKNLGKTALCLSGGGSFGYCECQRWATPGRC